MTFVNLSVDPKDLPDITEASYHEHPVRFRSKKVLVASIVFFLLLSAPVIVYFIVPFWIAGIAGAVWLLLFIFTLIVIFREFPKRAYALRERDITYRKGWIFHSVTSVPFNRIQHSEINQGPLDRSFNLASLNIYTAGGSSSDLTIPGLPHEEAIRLREYVAHKSAEDDQPN
ncbi:MAG: PH domain-containing protein [Cyclobacteriaceae bacterium]